MNPGFGGQRFIPHTATKIRRVRELLDRTGSRAEIEVDGGIDLDTIGAVVDAGATLLVAGHAVFGHGDPTAAVKALRRAAGAQVDG